MVQVFIYIMLYAGCALMAFNIYSYVRFSGHIRQYVNWPNAQRLFRIPIILLILFFAGYLSVAIFGHPDLVVSGILFGGSVFVLVMLILIQRAVDRIQENERLEAKVAAAEEANRAKTVFLSNMSHDIRTPLNAIIGYTTLAKENCSGHETDEDYIGKIEKASHQLLDIVDDVLEMSRIESGRMELTPLPINLEDCINETAELVRLQLEGKNIDFSVTCDIEHRWVVCDKNRLNRALMNLLCNAGKFTDENGSVSLSLSETGNTEDTGNYMINIKDTGIGMSSEFVEKLFDPFEREQTSTVSKIQGTGLGMAITKNIVDLMNGHIEVITEKGKGTEFIITLSLPLTQPKEEQSSESDPSDFSGIKVLLTEDNEINMEIAAAILEHAGFVVEKAENGQAALDKVKSSEPGSLNLILMDIQMPVMDGYAAARAIRALDNKELSSIPIIAMTANAFAEDIRAAQEAGMNAHIAKPLDVSVMMKTISKVLMSVARH